MADGPGVADRSGETNKLGVAGRLSSGVERGRATKLATASFTAVQPEFELLGEISGEAVQRLLGSGELSSSVSSMSDLLSVFRFADLAVFFHGEYLFEKGVSAEGWLVGAFDLGLLW